MNDELITRLRAAADKSENGGGEWYQLIHRCREAADALEAAQAEAARLHAALDSMLSEWDGLLAERDAEAAHADALDEALAEVAMFDGNHERRYRIIKAARAAHRERRTQDPKENTDG